MGEDYTVSVIVKVYHGGTLDAEYGGIVRFSDEAVMQDALTDIRDEVARIAEEMT